MSPVIAGKPEAPMAELILARLAGTPERLVMVGDRASTDGRMAAAVGAEFAHVLTGVDDDAPSGAASVPISGRWSTGFSIASRPIVATERRRLDSELVRRGLASSRNEALRAHRVRSGARRWGARRSRRGSGSDRFGAQGAR